MSPENYQSRPQADQKSSYAYPNTGYQRDADEKVSDLSKYLFKGYALGSTYNAPSTKRNRWTNKRQTAIP